MDRGRRAGSDSSGPRAYCSGALALQGSTRGRVDDLLRFRYEHDAGADIVYVEGELDVSSAGELQRAVANASCKGHGRELHLDLGGLTFVDSTGVQALLRIHESFEADGRRVVLTRPRRQVLSVLSLLGLDQMLNIKP